MGTILVLADRAHRRHRVLGTLARAGHAAQEAADGDQAMAVLRGGRVDLLLVDILMPHPGGYQFVCELYAQRDYVPPRMAFLTASHMTNEARLLVQVSGFAGAVVDLDDPTALLSAVEDALSHPPPDARVRAVGQDRLYPLVSRLCGRVADLEVLNARLQSFSALHAAQLQAVRSALDREVVKRLAGEELLAQRCQRLHLHAVRDPLTGLHNRLYLEASLAREESRARRTGEPLGIMMIAIDDFTQCADDFGHAGAEEVLRVLGRRLASLARAEDIVCRFGDDRFALLMTDAAPTAIEQRADALRAGVAKMRIPHDGRTLGPLTLSISLSFFPANGDSALTVLQAAEATLLRAKPDGRDRVLLAEARR